MDPTIKPNINKEQIAQGLGVSADTITVDESGIIKLDEKGMEKFNSAMNDPSVHYLKEFIRITKENRENISDKFFRIITNLENLLNTYNAPWFVPFYQSVRNAILVLIFINTNKILDEEDYKIAIDSAGEVIETLVENFNPDDGKYNTFPIKYSVKAIFDSIQEKLSENAPNLFKVYEDNLKKIADRKSKIKYDTIRMFIVLNELQKKHKKYEKLYNILLVKAYPTKYAVKKPKKNIKSEELLDAAGILVIEKQYPVEKFIQDHKDKIGNDILKALEIDEKELEEVHEKILVERLSEEIPEIKNLMDQLRGTNESLKDLENNELFEMITKAVNEMDTPEAEEETDKSAEDLFNKINEKLPDELKGRKKTEAELAQEKGE